MIILLLALAVQCPDGAPPPCARRAAPAAATPAIDPERIAVLPFRVAAADSLLGEGIAELVASEFQGGRGVRAVNMGTVLHAWRRAGGGLRAPLAQESAVRLSRGLGAGFYVDGSVVGSGQRLTISANVIRSSDGLVRRIAPVSGSPDSLEALSNRVIVGVLQATGGDARSSEPGRTTTSPAAMRAYLEGLSAWRRGDLQPANEAFERALDIDSTFAQAAFRRLELAMWVQDTMIPRRWGPLAWSMRDRLPRGDRAVLESFLGPRFPDATPATEWAAAADRATREAPESPEAWYQYGDLLYHGGGAIEADPLPHALRLLERAWELDNQEKILEHLVEGALLTGDTALLRRLPLEPLFDHFTILAWFAAWQLGDQRALAALRQRAGTWLGSLWLAGPYGASRAAVDSLYGLLVTQRRENRPGFFLVLTSQGRPRAAQAFAESRPANWRNYFDIQALEAAAWADGDTAAAIAADARLAALTPANPALAANVGCARAQWQYARGQPITADSAVVARSAPMCGYMVGLMKAAQANAPDLETRLNEAQARLRENVFGWNWAVNNFEGIVLARLWTARGDHRAALNAIRYHAETLSVSAGLWGSIKLEGPLAEAAGDTVGALRAYRRFLRMRGDPEPELRAQRDSAVAAIVRLERRTPTP